MDPADAVFVQTFGGQYYRQWFLSDYNNCWYAGGQFPKWGGVVAVLFRPYCAIAVRNDWIGGWNGADVVYIKCVGGQKYAQRIFTTKFFYAPVTDADIAVRGGIGRVGRAYYQILV